MPAAAGLQPDMPALRRGWMPVFVEPCLPCRLPGRAADADEKASRSLQGTQARPAAARFTRPVVVPDGPGPPPAEGRRAEPGIAVDYSTEVSDKGRAALEVKYSKESWGAYARPAGPPATRSS